MLLTDRFNLPPQACPKHDIVILAKQTLDSLRGMIVGNAELSFYSSKNDFSNNGRSRQVKTARLQNVAVARPWQGKKLHNICGESRTLSESLVGAVLQEAREGGLAYVYLDVSPDNTRAIKLYEKMGFMLGDDKSERIEQEPFVNNDSRVVSLGKKEDKNRMFCPLCLNQNKIEEVKENGKSVFLENLRVYIDGYVPRVNNKPEQ